MRERVEPPPSGSRGDGCDPRGEDRQAEQAAAGAIGRVAEAEHDDEVHRADERDETGDHDRVHEDAIDVHGEPRLRRQRQAEGNEDGRGDEQRGGTAGPRDELVGGPDHERDEPGDDDTPARPLKAHTIGGGCAPAPVDEPGDRNRGGRDREDRHGDAKRAVTCTGPQPDARTGRVRDGGEDAPRSREQPAVGKAEREVESDGGRDRDRDRAHRLPTLRAAVRVVRVGEEAQRADDGDRGEHRSERFRRARSGGGDGGRGPRREHARGDPIGRAAGVDLRRRPDARGRGHDRDRDRHREQRRALGGIVLDLGLVRILDRIERRRDAHCT